MAVKAQSPEVLSASSSSSSVESSFRELDDVFLQTQTRIWLGEVLQIRLDEQLSISDLLADGELMFEVSKVVWNMLLTNHLELRHVKAYRNEPFASRKSRGRYMPYSNVDSFLKICKILGLTGIDLFSPSDVVEKRDTRKVCMCIRSFSRKARSKNLSVPDFDIVTYTVAMPTDMVGCIRRSWESSQCRFLKSASYNLYKDSKEKFKQENTIADCARNYDTYSEESDGIESKHMVYHCDDSSTKRSYLTTSQMNSYLEIGGGVFSVVKNGTLAEHLLQLDIQNQEKNDYSQCLFESPCSTRSMGSLCGQHVEHDHRLNSSLSPSFIGSQIHLSDKASHIRSGVKNSNENATLDFINANYSLGFDASILEDSIDGNTPAGSYSHWLAISNLICHGTDSIDHVLFEGEDSLLDAFSCAGSPGSNSTPKIFENGSKRSLVDVFDAMEVSSAASMSSVSGAALNLGLEDQCDEEDDFKTVHFPELLNEKANFLNESQDMVKCETRVHSLTPDSEKSHFCAALEDNGSSANLFLPCPDQSIVTGHPDCVVSYDNGVSTSLADSDVVCDEDELSEVDSSTLEKVDCDQQEGLLSCKSHSPFDFHIWDHNEKLATPMTLNDNAGRETSPESVSQDVSLEETLLCMPTKASGDSFWHKDMNCIVGDNDKEIFESIVVKLEPNANSHSQEVCLNNIIERRCDDLNASPSNLAVEGSEKCSILSSTGDGSGFQTQNVIIGDIGEDEPSAYHKSVVPANPSEPTWDKDSCLTCECSENIGTEHIDNVHSQDEGIHGKVGVLAEDENLDGSKQLSVGTPKGKPHKRLLLKSVVSGTAAFGFLFLLFHLRRIGRGKGGKSSIGSSQRWKANGGVFSSRKGRKGG